MSVQRANPTGVYATALRKYLIGEGEPASRRVHTAARRVIAKGKGVSALVAAHQDVLTDVLRAAGEQERERILGLALRCLAEDLSSSTEVNAQLKRNLKSRESVEDRLRRQNEELTAAHKTGERERSRYQALFDLAPDAYVVTGMEGAIWEANAAAAALLRISRDLLPGQSLSGFVAEEGRDEFRARLHALHSGAIERIEDWEVRILPRHSAAIPASLTVVAERSVPAAVAGLRWLLRDVTERKRLEDERAAWLVSRASARAARRFEFLAKASALLVGALNLSSSLVNVAHLAASFLQGWCFISVVEPDGSLRQLEAAHADPKFEDLAKRLRAHCLFGGKTDLLPGGPLEVNSIDTKWIENVADGPDHSAILRQLRGWSATVLPLRIHKRLTGSIVLVRMADSRRNRAANRVLYEDLARRCALALENARLYREVVAQRDNAEKINRVKDEFVAILGHELRNPLTPIAGWTRLLKNEPAIARNARLSAGVSAMEKNAAALMRLVGECTDLVRISEGKFQVERAFIDINQIVAVAADSTRAMASERGLSLQVEPASRPVMVEGDAMRLEQVVNNLLINALKYTNTGCVLIRTSSVREQAEIEVTDTGIGIEAQYIEQIFEPFRQGATAWLTSGSGLGLGLAIAKRIVEMHGGRIWAESAGIGSGSTFRVRMPQALPSAQTRTVPERPPRLPRLTRGLQILLIEDSADIRLLMQTDLENMGHIVTTANDGRLGLEAARTGRPDLLISDIKMPRMDGYELIRILRHEPALRHMPAIALTGFGSQVEIKRAITAGFDVCLTKPAEPETIEEAIEGLAAKTALASLPRVRAAGRTWDQPA
jgi:PAS domain S-box-containing protein